MKGPSAGMNGTNPGLALMSTKLKSRQSAKLKRRNTGTEVIPGQALVAQQPTGPRVAWTTECASVPALDRFIAEGLLWTLWALMVSGCTGRD